MNNDLISRSALLKKGKYMYGFGKNKYVSEHDIATTPTVDAVEVVRCKDCRYRSGLTGRPPLMFHICTCAEGLTGAVRDNNFCPYGERR